MIVESLVRYYRASRRAPLRACIRRDLAPGRPNSSRSAYVVSLVPDVETKSISAVGDPVPETSKPNGDPYQHGRHPGRSGCIQERRWHVLGAHEPRAPGRRRSPRRMAAEPGAFISKLDASRRTRETCSTARTLIEAFIGDAGTGDELATRRHATGAALSRFCSGSICRLNSFDRSGPTLRSRATTPRMFMDGVEVGSGLRVRAPHRRTSRRASTPRSLPVGERRRVAPDRGTPRSSDRCSTT